MRSQKVAAAAVYKHSGAASGDGFMVGQCCAKAANERKTLEIPVAATEPVLELVQNWRESGLCNARGSNVLPNSPPNIS